MPLQKICVLNIILISTEQKSTTIEAVTCPPPVRPDVGLDGECGEHSISGICFIPNSVCVQSQNISVWICKCVFGYARRNNVCVQIPDEIFHSKSMHFDVSSNSWSTAIGFESITGMDIESKSVSLFGSSGHLFEAAIICFSNMTYWLNINSTIEDQSITRWDHQITAMVEIKINDLVRRDYVDISIRLKNHTQKVNIFLQDGTPANTTVGNIGKASDGENIFTSMSDDTEFLRIVRIERTGLIITRKTVSFEDLNRPMMIAFSILVNVYNDIYDQNVTILFTFIRRYFFGESLCENATSTTVIGQFCLHQPFIIWNDTDFSWNDTHLMLGSVPLDYTISHKVNEIIRLSFIDTDTKFNISVRFEITDINNNRPFFYKTNYNFDISRAAEPGDVIGVVHAYDLDLNSTLTFSISPNSTLKIDNYGVISLLEHIRETSTEYTVIVNDTLYSSTTTVRVTVQEDINANLGKRFNATLKENKLDSFEKLVYVDAYEDFTIMNDNDKIFALDNQTGTVSNLREIDRENETGPFILHIGARKQGQFCSKVELGLLTIFIEDENDNPPVFSQSEYQAEIIENEINELKMKSPIRTTDRDRNQTATFLLLNGNDTFEMNYTTGVIRTKVGIDREIVDSINLSIEANDGRNRNTTFVAVKIMDINDNYPVFERAENFSVFENVTSGTVVTMIKATDNDTGVNGEIIYQLNPRGHFQIDEKTGDITIGVGLDREILGDHYKLTIHATDQGTSAQSTSVELVVNIEDVNDEAPKFCTDTNYTASIREDFNCSIPILTVSAHDNDTSGTPNSHIVYSLTGKSYNFTIDKATGDIKCGDLDYEVGPIRYLLNVLATDSGSPAKSGSQTVIINIVDVNDNSPFFVTPVEDFTIRYVPSSKTERVVSFVNAMDLDSGDNGRVNYSIWNRASQFLKITDRGVILTNETLLPNVTRSYDLCINLTDNGQPPLTNSTCVNVNVTIYNGSSEHDIAFKDQNISMKIDENVSVGSYVGNVAQYLTSRNKIITYDLINGPSDFNITNGIILTNGEIDREKQAVYEFVVRAQSDNNEAFDLVVVTVNICDVNDNSPEFEFIATPNNPIEFEINENDIIGSTLTPYSHQTIEAIDKDIGTNAHIQFKITNLEENDCNLSFSINTTEADGKYMGTLWLQKQVDYEANKACSFNVTAYNPNKTEGSESHVPVLVLIRDVNDNPPVFNGDVNGSYTLNIPENTRPGVIINSTINVTDAEDYNSANGHVDINLEGSCWLTFYKPPDKDIVELRVNDSFQLDYDNGNHTCICKITATDRGKPPLSTNITVTIILTDENDNPPVVNNNSTNLTRDVSRFAEVGTCVLSDFNVTDADSGRNKELEFTLNNNTDKSFQIDRTNGNICLNSSLEHLDKEKIILEVIVSDKGDPPNSVYVEVIIFIIDDNPPPYFPTTYNNVTIQEHDIPNNKRKGEIGKVIAYDKNTNGVPDVCDCVYDISIPKGLKDRIDINNKTGVIRFKDESDTFDREKHVNGRVEFNVTASDMGAPVKTARTTFLVIITDINDQSPTFDNETYEFTVDLTQPRMSIGKVTATDNDENPHTEYSLKISEDVCQFSINTTTGEIFVTVCNDNSTFSSSSTIVAKGNVTAKDLDNDILKKDAPITIRIEYKINQHPPKFVKHNNSTISWTTVLNSIITEVEAKDEDNDGILYQIIKGNDRGFFNINKTGHITLRFPLDSTLGNGSRETVYLTIQATDNVAFPKSSEVTIIIEISGTNPGYCVGMKVHKRRVHDLNQERQNWSHALYGLCGALCVSIFISFVFLYKWRFHSGNLGYNQTEDETRNENISHVTRYEDLDKTAKRTPYYVSTKNSDYNLSDRWREVDQGPSRRFTPLQNNDQWSSNNMMSDLRFTAERDTEPFPDYLDTTSDPLPDYD